MHSRLYHCQLLKIIHCLPHIIYLHHAVKRIKENSIENEKKQESFTDHSIDIKKGDIMYIFSDGYADQTGGPNKKKFYYAPLKELFHSIHKLPMDEQKKKLDSTINNWMDGREQLDDITVIGIRF